MHLKSIATFCFLLGIWAAEEADSQDVAPVVRYEAIVDEQSGEIILVPADEADAEPVAVGVSEDDPNPTSSVGDSRSIPHWFSEAKNRLGEATFTNEQAGYAHFNSSGELVEVFAAPRTLVEKEVLLDKVELGGSLSKVSLFSGRSLPSQEEVERVTRQAINAALSFVCSTEPRPEELTVDVSLAVVLKVEGRFSLTMDWKPQRDCR